MLLELLVRVVLAQRPCEYLPDRVKLNLGQMCGVRATTRMISTELDSRRVAARDERATLFPTGGACSSLATAVRLQRLDGLLEQRQRGAHIGPGHDQGSGLGRNAAALR